MRVPKCHGCPSLLLSYKKKWNLYMKNTVYLMTGISDKRRYCWEIIPQRLKLANIFRSAQHSG
jgi:hypothetical protein